MSSQKLTYWNEMEIPIYREQHQNLKLIWSKKTYENQQNFGHSFGMLMPGREYSSESYRYGYQGSERDDKVKGKGNSYNTEFRQLDPRLGRWLSVDPVTHYHLSPYNSFDNNPIFYNDPNGANAGGGNPDDYLDSEGATNNGSETQNTGFELSIEENFSNQNGINSVDVTFVVKGKGIKDIQVQQFIKLETNNKNLLIDKEDENGNIVTVTNSDKTATVFFDQDGINYYTKEDEEKVAKHIGVPSVKGVGEFDAGIIHVDAGRSFASTPNPKIDSDVKKVTVITYVSVIDQKGVRHVVGKLYSFYHYNEETKAYDSKGQRLVITDSYTEIAKAAANKKGVKL